MSTLLFANRAKNMKNKAIINEDTTGELKILEHECKKLKEENVLLRTKLMKIEPNTYQKITDNLVSNDDDEYSALKSVINHFNIVNN
jgi:cell shape-determining protein MreC